ncbi:MAG: hypothetical protein AVDCRST_MAG38-493 [uncultured Solirubrobacteraceae bacterium]|uniref:Fibronectin type-III domain-containing protein n=1 Tax=uncultured Solirubrobacteraceae bacterium TaxID=1162706 RepID=A0A6J4RCN2_9ACTN|nr:MAG: hypothetical protein AVDCRST_MAG38-493 [uncultured Solirubrobacteraceae bacterium]
MSPSRRSDQAGFTLVEVVVAAAILLVGVLGALTMLDTANAVTARTAAREAGTHLAREVIEAARAVPYPNMTPARLQAELEAQPGLGDSSASVAGWTVVRRNVTFTLTATVCSVDDGTVAGDGYGSHAGGNFCADSTQTGTNDFNPDDYKRVAVTATWQRSGRTHSVTQEAVINNPGSAFAPAIRTLDASLTSPVLSGPAPGSSQVITFTTTTSIPAHDVRWALDGLDRGSAWAVTSDAAKKTWKFDWDIGGLVDGTYQVSATAFDEHGQAGAGRTRPMVLNRYAPAPPTGFAGGRNPLWGTDFAEFQWNPNPERDVTGYRVYRVTGEVPSAADVVVCTTSVSDPQTLTSCADKAAPAADLLRYYVVALATSRSSAPVEESARPALDGTLAVRRVNPRPSVPGDVTASVDSEGVRLSWAPSTDDGTVRFYRIYRDDNTSVRVRYDRTIDGEAVGFVDAAAGTAAHRYWITAVDDDFAESEFSSPVEVTAP